MPHAQNRVLRRMIVPALAVAFACAGTSAHAHLHWSRVNTVDSDTIALYHFDDATTVAAPPSLPLPLGLGLTSIAAGIPLSPTTDTPGAIFTPQALALPTAQTLRSTDTISQLAGDLTIECWFKWTPEMTSSTLEIGLQSGARLVVARDEVTPANDRFGIAGTHGSYLSAPGFTSWVDVGYEEASLNEWRHLALTIHSTGIHYNPASSHDVYSTGTVGRLYLNGHPTGSFPHSFDLAGLNVHDASRVTVVMRGGEMVIDELAVWRRDWSANGVNTNPFANGRGVESSVTGWLDYRE